MKRLVSAEVAVVLVIIAISGACVPPHESAQREAFDRAAADVTAFAEGIVEVTRGYTRGLPSDASPGRVWSVLEPSLTGRSSLVVLGHASTRQRHLVVDVALRSRAQAGGGGWMRDQALVLCMQMLIVPGSSGNVTASALECPPIDRPPWPASADDEEIELDNPIVR